MFAGQGALEPKAIVVTAETLGVWGVITLLSALVLKLRNAKLSAYGNIFSL